jgi:hypothetical protein
MSDYFSYYYFVIFFGVLFIEDTVLFVAETDTSEEMGGIIALKTIV